MTELSSLNLFYFEKLLSFLIIVRSSPALMLALVGTFGKTDEKLATELDINKNQCCTSLLD
jgi:hypothetical protein